MGDVDLVHNRITSSEHLRVEYAMNGTMHDFAGLTLVIIFKKIG